MNDAMTYEIRWRKKRFSSYEGIYEIWINGKKEKPLEFDDTLYFDHGVTFEEELKVRIEKGLEKRYGKRFRNNTK